MRFRCLPCHAMPCLQAATHHRWYLTRAAGQQLHSPPHCILALKGAFIASCLDPLDQPPTSGGAASPVI